MSAVGYSVNWPRNWVSPVIVASPHSGSDYPSAFLDRAILDAHEIRSSEDAYVDQLFDAAPALGMAFLTANMPRAYVDLNRSVQELDPAVIDGVARRGQNPRVASGLGVIPRVVAQGRPIYSGKISQAEAAARLDLVWHPYHRELQRLLNTARTHMGEAVLLDCHSMPREALDTLGSGGSKRAEIVLGDRFGVAADARIVEQIEAAFAAAGFEVARNTPFAGAYITQTYGRPSRRQHAVQVEIDRSLYMDEETIQPHSGFEEMRARLAQVLAEVARIGGSAPEADRLAAE
ncbi:N-formylglutamate deformylase [Tritonibacter multivorans]|uniref:N-formylglutamate deformylase n=1 Tax=Tritonibacter multivorans TaxID=928856 RepID=A0A0P1GCU7_9RHOB|nr:N-formylglutamate amidohydrolase [Tritonibacter multivorans]MDA7419827.1 N-formylglutamate amidohydrolase [Tritonibacter multivorans]CUH79188.1 N-formylglutamate deformylase [Tritonibacter multivorans]SFC15882.1 N-formylglutamate amidohydrolase [Tritonibacter multivorans]